MPREAFFEDFDESNERFDEERIALSFESATADLTIDHAKRTIWINDIYSIEKDQGHGSQLLDEVKKKYPKYVIEGIAHPTEFDAQPPLPSDEEMERAYDLGWDFKKNKRYPVGYELSPEEIAFVQGVAKRYSDHHKAEPFFRLRRFYKKNGFEIDGANKVRYVPPIKDSDFE